MKRITFAILLVTLIGDPSRAEAGAILFTDPSAFEATVGSFRISDFNDSSQHPCSMNFDLSRLQCTGDYGGISWSGDYASVGLWGGELSFRVSANSGLYPTEAVRAFGFDVVGGSFQTLGDIGLSYRLGSGYQASLILAPHSFFGLLLDPGDQLLSLNFFAPPGTPGLGNWPAVTIDNLRIAAVPEPTTLLLCGLGLATTMLYRRRR